MTPDEAVTRTAKERPILFNDAMVRAILSGAKTQTRRPMRINHVGIKAFHRWDGRQHKRAMMRCTNEDPLRPGSSVFCEDNRIGVPGDRLWVRECHHVGTSHAPDDYPHIFFRADGTAHQHDGRSMDDTPDSSAFRYDGPWTPSIHMPRWASRLTLRVTDVRVERVQEITEKDAVAEGTGIARVQNARSPSRGPLIDAFANTWDAAYPDSWSANPWVWVISFEVIK